MNHHWTEQDLTWAQREGIELSELDGQIDIATGDKLGTELVDPCTLGLGIEDAPRPVDEPLSLAVSARLTSFVPASGAASRMFKAVVQTHNLGLRSEAELVAAIEAGEGSLEAALQAYRGRGDLAVGRAVASFELGDVLDHWIETQRLPNLPKGLVPFHIYSDTTRTAAEEQVIEAAAMGTGATVRVHFTVPSGTERRFEDAVARVRPGLAAQDRQVELSMSVQHPATDTVALTPDGDVFRKADGTPLLRPGGHGSLLRNLGALRGDLVVIKNIDNVVRDDHRPEVLRWRRAL
ncbi:MAG: DUF4301 family protein, partial [Myxococcota bacterium]